MFPAGQQDVHEFFWNGIFNKIQDEINPKEKAKKIEGWDSMKSWKWYTLYYRDILNMLFGGQYEGNVVCKSCKNVSRTYDPFLEISLPADVSTLVEGLDTEFKKTTLPKSTGYKCEKCKKVTSIIQYTRIDKPPKYLIIHLKRLAGVRTKISRFIKFPSVLDISGYCVKERSLNYKLHAVCVHSGGATGGHFYAAGKRGDKVLLRLHISGTYSMILL